MQLAGTVAVAVWAVQVGEEEEEEEEEDLLLVDGDHAGGADGAGRAGEQGCSWLLGGQRVWWRARGLRTRLQGTGLHRWQHLHVDLTWLVLLVRVGACVRVCVCVCV